MFFTNAVKQIPFFKKTIRCYSTSKTSQPQLLFSQCEKQLRKEDYWSWHTSKFIHSKPLKEILFTIHSLRLNLHSSFYNKERDLSNNQINWWKQWLSSKTNERENMINSPDNVILAKLVSNCFNSFQLSENLFSESIQVYDHYYQTQFTNFDEIDQFADDTIGNFNRLLVQGFISYNEMPNLDLEVKQIELAILELSICFYYVDLLKRISNSDPNQLEPHIVQRIPTELIEKYPINGPLRNDLNFRKIIYEIAGAAWKRYDILFTRPFPPPVRPIFLSKVSLYHYLSKLQSEEYDIFSPKLNTNLVDNITLTFNIYAKYFNISI